MTHVSAELEAAVAHALEALMADVRESGDDTTEAYRRAEVALNAWTSRDVRLLDSDFAATCSINTSNTANSSCLVGTKGNDCGNGHGARDETDEVRVVYAKFYGMLPDGTRVHSEPGKGATRCIKRALKERPLTIVLRAVEGAGRNWKPGSAQFRIEAILDTWRGTGSLAERIDWLASLIADPLNDSVRSRIEDVRREVRAALDLPDSPSHQRRAAESERWLWGKGMRIELTGDGRFEILELTPANVEPPGVFQP